MMSQWERRESGSPAEDAGDTGSELEEDGMDYLDMDTPQPRGLVSQEPVENLGSAEEAADDLESTEARVRGHHKGEVRWWDEERGFGFVAVDGREEQAWFHRTMLAPGYRPGLGDSVAVELRRRDDGKLQAPTVRPSSHPPDPSPTPEPPAETMASDDVPDSGCTADDSRSVPPAGSTSPAGGGRKSSPSSSGAQPSSAAPTPTPTLTSRLEAIREAHASQDAAVSEEAEQCEREISRIERALQEQRDRLAAVARRRTELPQEALSAEATAVREHVHEIAGAATEAMEARQGELDAIPRVRERAAVTHGEDLVAEYLDVREMFPNTAACLTEKLPELAQALDRKSSWQDILVPVLRLEHHNPDDVTLVLGLRDEAPAWRVEAAFWEAVLVVEGATVGRVGRFPAARLSSAEDADLVCLALHDAFERRPTVRELRIAPHVERAATHARPELEAQPSPTAAPSEPAGVPAGGTLPEVAARLGASLPQLIEKLVSRGLPFEDDEIGEGVVRTLQDLFGRRRGPLAREPVDEPSVNRPPAVDPSSPQGIAARILLKLRSDTRIGEKHTAIEHAYGHGFADHEKDLAHRVTLRLMRAGILREKKNNGALHVSIEPARLGEAQRIIEGHPDAPTFWEDL